MLYTHDPQTDEAFAAAVKEYAQLNGLDPEVAERTLAKRFPEKWHNVLQRLQNKRQCVEQPPPRPAPPPKPRTSHLLALLDELKVPHRNQMDFVIAARDMEDPLGWIRQKVQDVADGKAELPGSKPASNSLVSSAAGEIRENEEYYLVSLEEAMLASGLDVNEIKSWHAIEREFNTETRIIFRHFGLDALEIVRELKRVSNLRKYRTLAGTVEERKAARARLAAAAEKVEGAESELAKVKAKIAKLEEQAASLQKEHDEAAAAVSQRDNAIQSLLADTVNENMLIVPRRLAWPKNGPESYVEEVVGKEEGIELRAPERIPFGARARERD